MAVWKVVIYTRPNGRSPFEEFREAVGTIEEAADIDVAVKQLSELGSYGLELLRRAEKMNDVWQLRPGKHRVFYFWDGRNQQYVLLHGFRKQTRKTPPNEIQRAENLRRQYLAARERGERHG